MYLRVLEVARVFLGVSKRTSLRACVCESVRAFCMIVCVRVCA